MSSLSVKYNENIMRIKLDAVAQLVRECTRYVLAVGSISTARRENFYPYRYFHTLLNLIFVLIGKSQVKNKDSNKCMINIYS